MPAQLAERDTEREELRTVTVDRRNAAGDVLGTVELNSEIFGRSPNVPLMHQVVTAQLAARRSGTQSTKTRAEVAGGGAKPYRQKGTGRARQGTIRAPQFTGGGVALGPKPRSYVQRTPRKMTRLALFCALSDRALEERICLVDAWSFEVPKTKDALRAVEALGLEGNILVVLGPHDAMAERSFANLPQVDLVDASQLTAYDVLVSDWIVFTDASLPGDATATEDSAQALAAKAKPSRSGDAASKPAKATAAKKATEPAGSGAADTSEAIPSDVEPTEIAKSEPGPGAVDVSHGEQDGDAGTEETAADPAGAPGASAVPEPGEDGR
ncbi:MAG: 50S ribosomal protein L4 [Acidimicrobiales bacterium]